MKKIKINFQSSISFFVRFFRWLVLKSFFSILFFCLLGILLGSFVFLRKRQAIQEITPQAREEVKFDEKQFEEVLRLLEERKTRFEEENFEQYADPFSTTTRATPSPSK